MSPRASPGTGNGSDRWTGTRVALLLWGALSLAGCAPDFKDTLGPRVPLDNVSGRAERDGAAAASLDVTVRNPTNNVSIGGGKTDASGYYAIAAPAGGWEVKIKGRLSGDFDSVTRGFVVDAPKEHLTLEPMDVFAYGAAANQPADSVSLDLPTSSSPVTFRWRPPDRPYSTAYAQLLDAAGAAVWYSPKATDSSAVWDGLGNQGTLMGTKAPTGTYTWRVKFDFPDSSEARTRSRAVIFQ